jgi:hypothetical protein
MDPNAIYGMAWSHAEPSWNYEGRPEGAVVRFASADERAAWVAAAAPGTPRVEMDAAEVRYVSWWRPRVWSGADGGAA